MKYKIVRLDGKEDKITKNIYESYDDAYKTLEHIFSGLCCSDVDYDLIPAYDIIKI